MDWALSRERYWGTPLPIWRCARGAPDARSARSPSSASSRGATCRDVDPHRPAIDEVTFACPECGEEARRVPEVIDTWYDSGAMPFAQWGYHPDLGRGIEEFERHFPADFISEAIDQTRGWFYTLMAEGVLHFDATAYRNVVCLGHIVAADGRKMSKSLGNMFDPWEALDRQGADALRWFMITNGSPWASRRIGHEVLDEVVRQFLLTLWNVYVVLRHVRERRGLRPRSRRRRRRRDRPLLDRWVLSQLARTGRDGPRRPRCLRRDRRGPARSSVRRRPVELVRAALAPTVLEPRRRASTPTPAPRSTRCYECLVTVATLLAPFTPFVAEALWRNLAAGASGRARLRAPRRLSRGRRGAPIDAALDDAMAAARAIVGLGRTVRVETKTRVRQPLAEAVVHLRRRPTGARRAARRGRRRAERASGCVFAESAEAFGRWRAKPNFKVLGPDGSARG